jgi:hypothetical protein
LAKIVTFEAFDQARVLGLEALRRIGSRDGLVKLENYLSDHGVDLIALRRQAAEASYQQGGYSL